MGVIALGLGTNELPWVGEGEPGPVLAEYKQLVGPVTAESWPGHEDLPLWSQLSRALTSCDPPRTHRDLGSFASRAAVRGPNTPAAVECASQCMQWLPTRRPSAEFLERSLAADFEAS